MERRGRPKSPRTQKFVNLAHVLEKSAGTAREIISGRIPAQYPEGKVLDFVFGGGIDLWCTAGRGGYKTKLFDETEV